MRSIFGSIFRICVAAAQKSIRFRGHLRLGSGGIDSVLGEIVQQTEDDHRDESYEYVEEYFSEPRGAASLPVTQFGPFGNSHLIEVLEIPDKFLC